MPVHNAEFYLEEAVESILGQTFTDFEFIIVDDGSTDQSLRILQRYARQDDRIVLTSRPNTGIVGALNEGLSMARGGLIARMDGDDVSMPDRFSRQVERLRRAPDCVVLGCRVLLIDPDGAPICETNKETSHEAIDAAHISRRGGAISHPAAMMRREALEAVGGYREEYPCAQDFDLFLRLAEIGRLANLPDTLFKYRQHFQMVSHSRREAQQEAVTRALKDAYMRRRLPLPQSYLQPRAAPYVSVWEQHRAWALSALGAGNLVTARKHALAAFRKAPFSFRSYRLMVHALRGP
jgi:glycosyltransferase involved in cell wall biosynthesis